MNRNTSTSLMQRALQSIPGGVNSPVRAFISVHGNPIYFEKASGAIEEEKQYQLSDYEYKKEDPTWSSCNPMVTTGRWKMEVVSDQDYVNFQRSEEL